MNSNESIILPKEYLALHQFPRSSKYDANWIMEHSMGLNTLWLTEWLCEKLDLKPGMRILDLACGKALSSIFLAKEFNLDVFAVDLWNMPTSNWERIRQENVENSVFPMQAEAHALPFPKKYFDCIICIDSFIYFGTNDLYLNYLTSFLKPNSQIAIVEPGLKKDFTNGLPPHLEPFWGQDCWSWHTSDWWKHLWSKTGLVHIEQSDSLMNCNELYLKWNYALNEANRNPWPEDIEVIKNDNDQYIAFHRLIGRKI